MRNAVLETLYWACVQTDAGKILLYGTSHQRPEMALTGTAFQIKVWEELLRLENGEIISYSELARRIGRPRSVRAVANAVANNRIAILIPCHRVIGKNSSLGGYRWGVEKKKSLLSKEGFPEL